MENDLELEDRILTMLSTQYERIYQIDIDNDSVLCIIIGVISLRKTVM